MHRLRSKSSVLRFRSAALLFCISRVLIPVSVGMLLYAVTVAAHPLMFAALAIAGVAIGATVLQWFVAARTHCPLCMTPVLAVKLCTKHRHARTIFGSHRLRVALAILFRNSFRCPYCNEPVAIATRNAARTLADSQG